MGDGPDIWYWIAVSLYGLLVAVVGGMWRDLKTAVASKASSSELETYRTDTRAALEKKAGMKEFERHQKEMQDELLKQSRQSESQFQQYHRDSLDLYKSNHALEIELGQIKIQVGLFASQMESEKRTRAEANKLLNDKLDRILERRTQQRQQSQSE